MISTLSRQITESAGPFQFTPTLLQMLHMPTIIYYLQCSEALLSQPLGHPVCENPACIGLQNQLMSENFTSFVACILQVVGGLQ